jgi:ATP/maltotriose-dependent transcriptional regulator MalT
VNSPQAMFAYLERHNLFVEPLDRQRTRYRLNPLVAEALTVLNSMYAVETVPKPPFSSVALPQPDFADASGDPWLVSEALSDREQQILQIAAGGLPNREIAQQLWISEATVKSHLKRIFDKLGARNRTEAVAIARKRQLMSVM